MAAPVRLSRLWCKLAALVKRAQLLPVKPGMRLLQLCAGGLHAGRRRLPAGLQLPEQLRLEGLHLALPAGGQGGCGVSAACL